MGYISGVCEIVCVRGTMVSPPSSPLAPRSIPVTREAGGLRTHPGHVLREEWDQTIGPPSRSLFTTVNAYGSVPSA